MASNITQPEIEATHAIGIGDSEKCVRASECRQWQKDIQKANMKQRKKSTNNKTHLNHIRWHFRMKFNSKTMQPYDSTNKRIR